MADCVVSIPLMTHLVSYSADTTGPSAFFQQAVRGHCLHDHVVLIVSEMSGRRCKSDNFFKSWYFKLQSAVISTFHPTVFHSEISAANGAG